MGIDSLDPIFALDRAPVSHPTVIIWVHSIFYLIFLALLTYAFAMFCIEICKLLLVIANKIKYSPRIRKIVRWLQRADEI